jgi:hypothetical protein
MMNNLSVNNSQTARSCATSAGTSLHPCVASRLMPAADSIFAVPKTARHCASQAREIVAMYFRQKRTAGMIIIHSLPDVIHKFCLTTYVTSFSSLTRSSRQCGAQGVFTCRWDWCALRTACGVSTRQRSARTQRADPAQARVRVLPDAGGRNYSHARRLDKPVPRAA